MQGTPTQTVRFDDEDTVEAFCENVTEGDYITVVYPTESNGGGLHRTMGHVTKVRTLHGGFDDLWFEVEESDRDGSGEQAYLHVNPGTGSYYFSDNKESDSDFEIERVAWTPEN